MNHTNLLMSLVLTLSFACVGEPVDGQLTMVDGRPLIVAASSDSEIGAQRSPLVEPPDAGTEPWEPGNGYFERDPSDPEAAVYFDTCPAETSLPLELVTEVSVNPGQNQVTYYSVPVFIPPGLVLLQPDGTPLEVGDRLSAEPCSYSSSYSECSGEPLAIDVGTVIPGLEAIVTVESTNRVYWDYGQDRYRFLENRRVSCEGADCEHPIVTQFFGTSCERHAMEVYRRIPAPVL